MSKTVATFYVVNGVLLSRLFSDFMFNNFKKEISIIGGNIIYKCWFTTLYAVFFLIVVIYVILVVWLVHHAILSSSVSDSFLLEWRSSSIIELKLLVIVIEHFLCFSCLLWNASRPRLTIIILILIFVIIIVVIIITSILIIEIILVLSNFTEILI